MKSTEPRNRLGRLIEASWSLLCDRTGFTTPSQYLNAVAFWRRASLPRSIRAWRDQLRGLIGSGRRPRVEFIGAGAPPRVCHLVEPPPVPGVPPVPDELARGAEALMAIRARSAAQGARRILELQARLRLWGASADVQVSGTHPPIFGPAPDAWEAICRVGDRTRPEVCP